jgi:phosphoglucomutase
LAGARVVQLLDYQLQKSTNLLTGEQQPIALPKSNVLQYITADGSKISARPSGTEPKIKFYFSVNAPLSHKEAYETILGELKTKIDQIIRDMQLA